MLWVIEESLIGSYTERKARLEYIKEMTGDKRISWEKFSLFPLLKDYYYCITNEGVNGVFITAHMYLEEVKCLCNILNPKVRDFFAINACKIRDNVDKEIMTHLVKSNPEIHLFFAKQEYNTKSDCYMNLISDVGSFGFQTSKSERITFLNRKKGILEAVEKGFDLVEL